MKPVAEESNETQPKRKSRKNKSKDENQTGLLSFFGNQAATNGTNDRDEDEIRKNKDASKGERSKGVKTTEPVEKENDGDFHAKSKSKVSKKSKSNQKKGGDSNVTGKKEKEGDELAKAKTDSRDAAAKNQEKVGKENNESQTIEDSDTKKVCPQTFYVSNSLVNDKIRSGLST